MQTELQHSVAKSKKLDRRDNAEQNLWFIYDLHHLWSDKNAVNLFDYWNCIIHNSTIGFLKKKNTKRE